MRYKIGYFIIFIITLFACNKKQQQNVSQNSIPKVVKASGYILPIDSMLNPKVILAGKPKLLPSGNIKLVFANTNVHLVSNPKIFAIDKPEIITPKLNNNLFPKSLQVIESPIIAGVPQVVTAKDAYIRD